MNENLKVTAAYTASLLLYTNRSDFKMAYVYKRGKTWAVRFSKRYRTWDADSQKEISKLKQKQKGGFHTKAEATAYGIKMEAESLNGADITTNPIFSEYYLNWYHTFKETGVADATKIKYKYQANLIKANFGSLRIKDITRTTYQKIINNLSKTHAPVTIKKLNSSIKACVYSAIQDGVLSQNFTTGIKATGNKDRELKVDYLNIKEINNLVKTTISNLDPSVASRYMVLTAIYTGARLGEISALHWDDLDFKHNIIHITKSYSWQTHKINPTKTKSSVRDVPVNDFLMGKLKELQRNSTNFVFTGKDNLPPTSGDVNSVLRSLLAKANINKDIHFHSLRHIHVAYLLSKHIDIYAISKRLGHSSVSITLDTYAYLIDEFKKTEDKKIVSNLDSLTM